MVSQIARYRQVWQYKLLYHELYMHLQHFIRKELDGMGEIDRLIASF